MLLARQRSVDVLPKLSVVVIDLVRVAVFRRRALVHVRVVVVQALLLSLVRLLARPDLYAFRPLAGLGRSRRQPVAASVLRRDRPALGLARVAVHDLDHVLVDQLRAGHASASEVGLRGQPGVVHAEPELPGARVEVVEQQVLGVGVVRGQVFVLDCVLVDLDLDLLAEKPVVLLRPRRRELVVLVFDDAGLRSEAVRVRLTCCCRPRGFRAGTCRRRRTCCRSFTRGSGRQARV